jgi:DNA replication protein DnaC
MEKIQAGEIGKILPFPKASDDEPEEPPEECTYCAGAGWVRIVDDADLGSFPIQRCPVCAGAREHERSSRLAGALLGQLRRELGGRLARCAFDNFEVDRALSGPVNWHGKTSSPDQQRKTLADVRDHLQCYADNPTGGIYLAGPPGAGKSHLAAALAQAVASAGRSVSYASVPELLAFVRSGFGDSTADDRVRALAGVYLLVLDDLGAGKQSDWANDVLFRIVNERWREERLLVVTSNLPLGEQEERIASRLGQMCRAINLRVGDYRKLR